jgi:cyclopropane-fatty-acyl-phospholipid synthase
VKRLLALDGIYLHHAITRPAKRDDKQFRKKRAEYVAITRYIFPGGELDYIGMTAGNLERFGFEVHDVEGWREHYARTCRLWHDRLLANYDKAMQEVGEHKTRLWLLYLAGCSLGFERSTLNIFQTVATVKKRGASSLPPTRADLYR